VSEQKTASSLPTAAAEEEGEEEESTRHSYSVEVPLVEGMTEFSVTTKHGQHNISIMEISADSCETTRDEEDASLSHDEEGSFTVSSPSNRDDTLRLEITTNGEEEAGEGEDDDDDDEDEDEGGEDRSFRSNRRNSSIQSVEEIREQQPIQLFHNDDDDDHDHDHDDGDVHHTDAMDQHAAIEPDGKNTLNPECEEGHDPTAGVDDEKGVTCPDVQHSLPEEEAVSSADSDSGTVHQDILHADVDEQESVHSEDCEHDMIYVHDDTHDAHDAHAENHMREINGTDTAAAPLIDADTDKGRVEATEDQQTHDQDVQAEDHGCDKGENITPGEDQTREVEPGDVSAAPLIDTETSKKLVEAIEDRLTHDQDVQAEDVERNTRENMTPGEDQAHEVDPTVTAAAPLIDTETSKERVEATADQPTHTTDMQAEAQEYDAGVSDTQAENRMHEMDHTGTAAPPLADTETSKESLDVTEFEPTTAAAALTDTNSDKKPLDATEHHPTTAVAEPIDTETDKEPVQAIDDRPTYKQDVQAEDHDECKAGVHDTFAPAQAQNQIFERDVQDHDECKAGVHDAIAQAKHQTYEADAQADNLMHEIDHTDTVLTSAQAQTQKPHTESRTTDTDTEETQASRSHESSVFEGERPTSHASSSSRPGTASRIREQKVRPTHTNDVQTHESNTSDREKTRSHASPSSRPGSASHIREQKARPPHAKDAQAHESNFSDREKTRSHASPSSRPGTASRSRDRIHWNNHQGSNYAEERVASTRVAANTGQIDQNPMSTSGGRKSGRQNMKSDLTGWQTHARRLDESSGFLSRSSLTSLSQDTESESVRTSHSVFRPEGTHTTQTHDDTLTRTALRTSASSLTGQIQVFSNGHFCGQNPDLQKILLAWNEKDVKRVRAATGTCMHACVCVCIHICHVCVCVCLYVYTYDMREM
jgi:hypothetical protein